MTMEYLPASFVLEIAFWSFRPTFELTPKTNPFSIKSIPPVLVISPFNVTFWLPIKVAVPLSGGGVL
jgi:hypothetical protein